MPDPDSRLDGNQHGEPQPHSIVQSILLHLLPGSLPTVAFHLVVSRFFEGCGFPEAFGYLLLGNFCVFYPTLWGVLFYYARQRGNQGLSLEGVVTYRRKMSLGRLLGWSLLILVLVGLVFPLSEPLTKHIQSYFDWYPIKVDQMYDGEFPKSILILTFAIAIVTTAVITPITEEVYYRGFLLPRMPKELGAAGPVAHSFLFAVSHFHQPWMIPVRTVGLLPLIYVTRITKSILPGSVTHCLVNGADIIIAAVARLR